MLWVDKYRPKRLEQLTYHAKMTQMLRKMVLSGNFPHLLFYGPPGAGKKTRILALLQEVFGKGVTKIKTEHRSFKVNSRTIEITTLGSNYHIEMNPSDAGIYDRVVVQDIIKEIASSQSLITASTITATQSNHNHNSKHKQDEKEKESQQSNRAHFKVVVLNEVDKLTKDAQHGLRRTMEKYMSTCRIILQCDCVSKVIEPLRSRCLSIRIAAPSHEQIVEILKDVANKERVSMDDEFARQIAIKSQRNLRRALLMLQVSSTESNRLVMADAKQQQQRIKTAPWQLFIEELARIVVEEQSPQRLLLARQKLYELLANCIPADVIFEKLTVALMENVDDSLRKDIVHWAAYHEHRMQQGAKPIIHLEAFLARFMQIYKKWQLEFFG
mmetsp:Transcript_6885/g.11351  ORF Transcript_6885/g.11351 Transcript_6885/m.11351 type:complete len:385 (+) Transcript_6885:24-1178(+)|eukprot:CAMPEP_0197077016 /NCGR_PEP_ID=MMETSP1384-20130603/212404_1 /TAXON_ID=29189 /ORGANISM="Ammonia sp." /LENGTH=384 /DNA_ID=CAMNT_0042515875 /DNA_START=77 /DNA_END=1231 /DNA_ORIENTATION=-